MAELEWTVSDYVGLLTLNRPDKRNALTEAMIRECVARLDAARTDDAVRVIVITGAGDAFCAGGDVSKMEQGDVQSVARSPQAYARSHLQAGVQRIPLAIEALDKPVIAAVNGSAVGAGMDLALMCDMRLLSTAARLSEGYIRAGLIPGDGGCYFLPRLVGPAKALELLVTGDFIDAQAALELGLANRICEPDQLLPQTMELAGRIAAGPPVHVQLIKRNVYASANLSLRDSLELAASHMAVVRSMNDSKEALAALRERRTGRYDGT